MNHNHFFRRCYELSQNVSDGNNELGQHQHQKGQKVKSGEGLRRSFKVTCQTAKPCSPSKTAFDHPPTRQKDEALLGLYADFVAGRADARPERDFDVRVGSARHGHAAARLGTTAFWTSGCFITVAPGC